MTKLRMTKTDQESMTVRLRKWPYWKLLVALAVTGGFTGLDVILIDFVPFIDEFLLGSLNLMLLNVLRLKVLYGSGELKVHNETPEV